MTPRRRSNRKAGWPANLYESRGYFTFRNPATDEVFGLGRNKAEAFTQALEANLHLAGELRKERLIDRLTGDGDRTVGAWFEKYAQMLAERTLADNTRRGYKSLAKTAERLLGSDTKIRSVTALQVSDALESVVKQGNPRLAQALRSFMRETFKAAIVKGWRDENPVRDVKATPVTVKRARMTLEVFQAIYNGATETWLRNAMMLALVAGQRREDIAVAQFKDVRDGGWWLEQGKTGSRVCLPLELRLDAIGLTLGDVVRQCRTTGVLSQNLIHQTEPRGNSPIGQAIWKDTISRRFTDELKKLDLTFEGKTPPTFHEIRSLSARLYKAQGNVNVQELLGHKSADTTLLYQDGRGEWVKVRVTV